MEDRRTAVTPENIKRVDDYFTADTKSSIRTASFDLGLPFGTIWSILRRELKWKAYRPTRVNRLTPKNKQDRLTFSHWLLAQPEGFEQKVIWSDEKWFCLHPSPNSQTDRTWGPFHPEEEVVCNFQGDNKVMAWAALVNGKALEVRWMVDEDGRPQSVTAASYLNMMKNHVWPEVRASAGQLKLWMQQDGATSHTAEDVIEFLMDKFRGRLISRRSPIDWPAYSPDMNPLDYHFWAYAMMHVRRVKPQTIDELKEVVEDVARTIPEEMVRKTVANIRKRCRACIMADGDHFEAFLKKI